MHIMIMYLYCKHVRSAPRGGTVDSAPRGGTVESFISLMLVNLALSLCCKSFTHRSTGRNRHMALPSVLAIVQGWF
jgi:hypothetical protein